MASQEHHRSHLRLDIVVTDPQGKVVSTRRIEGDIFLRNWLVATKANLFVTNTAAADGGKDVNANAYNPTSGAISGLRNMLGNGAAVETNVDFRIQAPLYTAPDAVSIGFTSLGGGNQIVLAVTSSHTFAVLTTVTEAGLVFCSGSVVTYLTNINLQVTRNTFAGVVVNPGNTFTSTYTITGN